MVVPQAPSVYVVFGAYGGIGTELAKGLAAQGARLALSGRDPHRLAALASDVGALALPADATDFRAVDACISRTVEEFGRLDGVASCVGSLLLKPAHLTKPEEWQSTLQTNLSSAFAILRASVRPMIKQGSGSVVLTSTAAASIGLANHEAIAAAKGGIEALVRSAAATYGSAGIRVNGVAPGLVDTPLTARITGNDRALRASEAMHGLGRIGKPGEVAHAIRWLLDGETSWVTGQTVAVDGGLANVRPA
jgi:NAD(P)-dependent dehydrogenase (short-subunit alcohol dehydrogenase family)